MSNLSSRRVPSLLGLFSFWLDRVILVACRAIFSDWLTRIREIGDPHGVIAPSDETAIEAARKVIDELLADCANRRIQTRPLIVVKNEADEIIYRYPSN